VQTPPWGLAATYRTWEPGVWYASNREQGAWAELFRHFVDEGVDPFEVRRRVGRVSVDLHVLDLTDRMTRSHLGVDEADPVSDDCAITRPSPARLAMQGLTPYLHRQRRYPVVKRSQCSSRR
jgi:hypothetical protein